MTFLRWLAEVISPAIPLAHPRCCPRCPRIRTTVSAREARFLTAGQPLTCVCGAQLRTGGTNR